MSQLTVNAALLGSPLLQYAASNIFNDTSVTSPQC